MLSKYNKSKVFAPVLVIGFLFISIVALFGQRFTDSSSSNAIIPRNSTPTISVPGEAMEMSGEVVCLPHIDKSGPQTEECASGLKTPEGVYYALRDSDSTYNNISGLPIGTTVTITGVFYPQDDMIYPTEGVIEISSISK